jgi:hypothetical protein
MKFGLGILITILLTAISFKSNHAQESKSITNQNLIWYGYFNTLHFSDKLFLTIEFQERHFIKPFAQSQFVTRTHLHVQLSSGWDAAAGMCLFLQGTNDPFKNSINVPELRPHVEFNYKQKLSRLTFEHRYKIESRFFHNVNSDRSDLEAGYFFGNFRFRYRIQATIPFATFKNGGKVKLKVSDEIHINAGHSIVLNTFDQNRIYLGINTDITKNLSFEIGYLNWFQKRITNADYYNRHILRFTFSQRLNLSKK